MVEFGLDFEKQDFPNPPEGKLYVKNLPGEDEEKKQYMTDGTMEMLDLGTYIDLMVANLKRMKKQTKKKISANRRGLA